MSPHSPIVLFTVVSLLQPSDAFYVIVLLGVTLGGLKAVFGKVETR